MMALANVVLPPPFRTSKDNELVIFDCKTDIV